MIKPSSNPKLLSNHRWLFVFIVAFIAMQWTTAHIHLAEHHDHDGSHHQHNLEAHLDHFVDDHVDIFDLSHQLGDANIIELVQVFGVANEKKLEKPDTSALIIYLIYQPLLFVQSVLYEPPFVANIRLVHFYHSASRPRAPPHLS